MPYEGVHLEALLESMVSEGFTGAASGKAERPEKKANVASADFYSKLRRRSHAAAALPSHPFHHHITCSSRISEGSPFLFVLFFKCPAGIDNHHLRLDRRVF